MEVMTKKTEMVEEAIQMESKGAYHRWKWSLMCVHDKLLLQSPQIRMLLFPTHISLHFVYATWHGSQHTLESTFLPPLSTTAAYDLSSSVLPFACLSHTNMNESMIHIPHSILLTVLWYCCTMEMISVDS
jgi:hypothetical protein